MKNPTAIVHKILLLTFTGMLLMGARECRLGNKVVDNSRNENQDRLSGYYKTDYQNGQYCTLWMTTDSEGNPDSTCVNVAENLAPVRYQKEFYNPTGIVLNSGTTADYIFFNPTDDNIGIRFTLDTTQSSAAFQRDVTYSAYSIWSGDSTCQTVERELGMAALYSNDAGTTFDGFPISGRLGVSIGKSFSFSEANPGSCDAVFQQFENCYQNLSLCGNSNEPESIKQERYNNVHAIFGPFVTAGSLVPAQISEVHSLIYSVLYQ